MDKNVPALSYIEDTNFPKMGINFSSKKKRFPSQIQYRKSSQLFITINHNNVSASTT